MLGRLWVGAAEGNLLQLGPIWRLPRVPGGLLKVLRGQPALPRPPLMEDGRGDVSLPPAVLPSLLQVTDHHLLPCLCFSPAQEQLGGVPQPLQKMCLQASQITPLRGEHKTRLG